MEVPQKWKRISITVTTIVSWLIN